ncbi:hypothetical protein D9M72_579360 [compost metagenome]
MTDQPQTLFKEPDNKVPEISFGLISEPVVGQLFQAETSCHLPSAVLGQEGALMDIDADIDERRRNSVGQALQNIHTLTVPGVSPFQIVELVDHN